jgi:hypothetical protein
VQSESQNISFRLENFESNRKSVTEESALFYTACGGVWIEAVFSFDEARPLSDDCSTKQT